MKSLRGHFLIASPHLADPNFYRSVVLMIQHDEKGAFGVVLNRPTNNTIADLWNLVSPAPCDISEPVHVGGPVPGPLIAIHSDPAQCEMDIADGVFFASSKEAIIAIVSHPQGPFRLFVGYSGWGAGQLDQEMESGSWLSGPAAREDVFSHYDELWHRVSRRIGLDIISPTIRNQPIPDDPSMN